MSGRVQPNLSSIHSHVGSDTPLVVGAAEVPGNDSDEDGDPPTASLVDGPAGAR